MPWTAEDAERHTKKADSAKRQRMWAEIANSVLAETGDEGRAIREANARVGRDHEEACWIVVGNGKTRKASLPYGTIFELCAFGSCLCGRRLFASYADN
jgi:hypothetical protein